MYVCSIYGIKMVTGFSWYLFIIRKTYNVTRLLNWVCFSLYATNTRLHTKNGWVSHFQVKTKGWWNMTTSMRKHQLSAVVVLFLFGAVCLVLAFETLPLYFVWCKKSQSNTTFTPTLLMFLVNFFFNILLYFAYLSDGKKNKVILLLILLYSDTSNMSPNAGQDKCRFNLTFVGSLQILSNCIFF